jgi:hypothetical protein
LISSDKKLVGHSHEGEFAKYIDGKVISGTQKADVVDTHGNYYSVKSGKKWQIFLYNYNRICESKNLIILKDCLDCFTEDTNLYFKDRVECIQLKETYVKNYGRDKAKKIPNSEIERNLPNNSYIDAKNKLRLKTQAVCKKLTNKEALRAFLDEALFSNNEVAMLGIIDETYIKDNKFKVFHKEDILDTFCNVIQVDTSAAGKVPEDYNVEGQKTLFRYKKGPNLKNLGEIEIRNDSHSKYRLVRFNMYSSDVLSILLKSSLSRNYIEINENVIAYGRAISKMHFD